MTVYEALKWALQYVREPVFAPLANPGGEAARAWREQYYEAGAALYNATVPSYATEEEWKEFQAFRVEWYRTHPKVPS